jgi:CubicO group peptidase (beta-lactamase class C family)
MTVKEWKMFRSRAIRIGVVFAALMVGRAWAVDLPRARPEEVGLSAERLDYIDKIYAERVEKGEIAGAVILVARHGKIAHFNAVGYANVETKQKMETGNIFRLYSMTKPITSAALMTLYQDGQFLMSDPISKYLPEFANLRVARNPDGPFDATVAADQPPTMQDILRHTAGFTHGNSPGPFDSQYAKADIFGLDVTLAEMTQKLATLPLHYQPGTKWEYSIGPSVASRLVEVLSGMPYDEYLEKRVLKPLGMTDTDFWVPPGKAARLVPMNWFKDGKITLLDEAHGDPKWGFFTAPAMVNSYTVNHKRKDGSYGLVATAADYWRFAQAMANGGVLNGARVLSPETIQFMMTDQLGGLPVHYQPGPRPSGLGFGLGFAVLKDAVAAGYPSPEGTVFWDGAAGTQFWIDPKHDMVVVAMIQQFGPPGSEPLAAQLHALVASALVQ